MFGMTLQILPSDCGTIDGDTISVKMARALGKNHVPQCILGVPPAVLD